MFTFENYTKAILRLSNIGEYLLSLRLGKYSLIFTEPKANNFVNMIA